MGPSKAQLNRVLARWMEEQKPRPSGGMRFNPTVRLDPTQVVDRRGEPPVQGGKRVNSGANPFDVVRQFMAMRGDTQLPALQPPPQAPRIAPQPMLGGGAPAGGGSYDDWVETIARIKGLSPEDKAAFYALGMGESGGRNIPQGIEDYNSENGIPAFGPWQVIEPTFNQYKEPGYDNWKDPIANGLASLNYQRAKYGKLRSKPGY